jgi:hypothetical protein
MWHDGVCTHVEGVVAILVVVVLRSVACHVLCATSRGHTYFSLRLFHGPHTTKPDPCQHVSTGSLATSTPVCAGPKDMDHLASSPSVCMVGEVVGKGPLTMVIANSPDVAPCPQPQHRRVPIWQAILYHCTTCTAGDDDAHCVAEAWRLGRIEAQRQFDNVSVWSKMTNMVGVPRDSAFRLLRMPGVVFEPDYYSTWLTDGIAETMLSSWQRVHEGATSHVYVQQNYLVRFCRGFNPAGDHLNWQPTQKKHDAIGLQTAKHVFTVLCQKQHHFRLVYIVIAPSLGGGPRKVHITVFDGLACRPGDVRGFLDSIKDGVWQMLNTWKVPCEKQHCTAVLAPAPGMLAGAGRERLERDGLVSKTHQSVRQEDFVNCGPLAIAAMECILRGVDVCSAAAWDMETYRHHHWWWLCRAMACRDSELTTDALLLPPFQLTIPVSSYIQPTVVNAV